MHSKENYFKINHFINYYCDALKCAVGEFLNIDNDKYCDFINCLNIEEEKVLTELAVLKNLEAGVKNLYLKVKNFNVGQSILEKYNLNGYIIVSANVLENLPTSALTGNRLILEIESILNYNVSQLSKIVDFVAKTDSKVLINLGQDLEELGKIVNLYNRSPVEILEDFGFLDRDCFIKGLNFIDKEDQKILKNYNTFLIFSPRSDGNEGKGAINLYNFIYNDLKFGFSSGNCYNIDMLAEARLAKLNTNNLMYDFSLVSDEVLLNAICLQEDLNPITTKIELDLPIKNLFENKIIIHQENLESLKVMAKEIIKKVKEKI